MTWAAAVHRSGRRAPTGDAAGRYDAGMCNRHGSPEVGDVERCWHVGAHQPGRAAEVFPRAPGPFLLAGRENQPGRELVIGQRGLVPGFAETPKLSYSTNRSLRHRTGRVMTKRVPDHSGVGAAREDGT